MNLLKHRSMRFYLGFILILALAIGGSAVAAFGDSGGATVTVNGVAGVSERGTYGESV